MCTLNRPVSTLDIQCAHWPIQCAHWENIYFCRMSSVVIGCPHQQPGSSSQQQRSSSSLWSFMSLFPPAMKNRWLLLRCIHAYQWLKCIEFTTCTYAFKNLAVGSTKKTCVPRVNLILLQKKFTGSQKYTECAHWTKICPVNSLG